MPHPWRAPILFLLVLAAASAGPAARAAEDFDDARKEFRRVQKLEDPKARAASYTALSGHDRAETVEEMVGALAKEQSGGVLLSAIRALGRLEKPEALEAIAAAVRSKPAPVRLYLLAVMADGRAPPPKELLLEVLDGKDAPAAAQAALAAGKRRVTEALPKLEAMLASEDWHLRAAAARAIATFGALADAKKMVPALAASLARSQGRERAEIVLALQALTRLKFANDPEAWKKVGAGAKPEEITAAPVAPPYLVGIPIYGKRFVLLVDNGIRTDDGHPWQDKDRLKALCQVPDARPVPWYEIRTIRQFEMAHAERVIADLKDVSFEVIAVGLKPKAAFGRFAPASDGTKKTAKDMLANLKAETQHDDFGALSQALDTGGKKDAAWGQGPDEIAYVTISGPWLAPVTDPGEVAATIGLRARFRMVPIHTVGVADHPYDMLRQIAEISGGTYLDLSK